MKKLFMSLIAVIIVMGLFVGNVKAKCTDEAMLETAYNFYIILATADITLVEYVFEEKLVEEKLKWASERKIALYYALLLETPEIEYPDEFLFFQIYNTKIDLSKLSWSIDGDKLTLKGMIKFIRPTINPVHFKESITFVMKNENGNCVISDIYKAID